MTTKAGFFIGGTTGLRDGTLVSIGGAVPIAFPAIDTVLTCHVRQVDDATGLDTGEDSTTNVMLIPRSGESISANNSAWTAGDGSTPFDLGVKATGGNQPVYLKQTGSASGPLVISALAWGTGSRVGQVGSVVATAGNTQAELTWGAVSGAASYDVYHSASNSAPDRGATPTIAGASSGVVVTGLTNDVARYFWVRANAATGAGVWSAVASATPVLVSTLFTDTFASADSAKWNVVPSVAGGRGSWDDHSYAAYSKPNVAIPTNGFTVTFTGAKWDKPTTNGWFGVFYIVLLGSNGEPVVSPAIGSTKVLGLSTENDNHICMFVGTTMVDFDVIPNFSEATAYNLVYTCNRVANTVTVSVNGTQVWTGSCLTAFGGVSWGTIGDNPQLRVMAFSQAGKTVSADAITIESL